MRLLLQFARHSSPLSIKKEALFACKRFYRIETLRKTTALPDKVGLKLSKDQNEDKDTKLPRSRHVGDIVQVPGSTYGGLYNLKWIKRPQNVLIVKKPDDPKTEKALVEVANWLRESQSNINVIVEPEVAVKFQKELPFVHVIDKSDKDDYTRTVDFAITLGGDGTMLHLSSLFPKAAPPVVSFSLGTLCFLMTYNFEKYQHVLADMIAGRVGLMMRMRLFCSLHRPNGQRIKVDGIEVGDRQVMNEVTVHRGRYPQLTAIDCFVDEQFLTACVADGLIVSTPTGSTAYSLSAGGPIVHPSVQSLVLTPICPRSLSFRTVLLPPSSTIELKIGEKSRTETEVLIDGQEVFMLNKGEYAKIRMSKYPIPCITHISDGASWEKDINDLLKWNQTFGSNIQ